MAHLIYEWHEWAKPTGIHVRPECDRCKRRLIDHGYEMVGRFFLFYHCDECHAVWQQEQAARQAKRDEEQAR